VSCYHAPLRPSHSTLAAAWLRRCCWCVPACCLVGSSRGYSRGRAGEPTTDNCVLPRPCSGYADVGFNREVPDREVVSPNLDGLVASGVHLTRHYVHQYCTPTRTSVQSGRLPVHVSTGLGSPCNDNTGISQNMTGFAERLQEAGYTTAFAGKWDAGMVTPA
jgi:hypothetical protein